MITWNDSELELINKYGELCIAVAEAAMKRNGLNFDDIERINDHYESHKWGSNADRKYRKTAVRKAILKVAATPKAFTA